MINLFKRLFIDKTNNSLIQFIRYGFVSGLSLLVDVGVLILLTEVFGVHYLASATISFIFGLATNYILSTIWVFNKSKYKPVVELIIFASIGLIGLGINNLLMWLFTDKIGLFYLASKFIAIFATFTWNFTVRKTILFSSEKRSVKSE